MLRVSAASRNSSANSASAAYSAKGSPLAAGCAECQEAGHRLLSLACHEALYCGDETPRPSCFTYHQSSHLCSGIHRVTRKPQSSSSLGHEALDVKLETPLLAAAHMIAASTYACNVCQQQKCH